jgi:hypothetical protein
MHQRELAEKKEEEEWDYWLPSRRNVVEKWLAKDEGGSSNDSSGEEVSKITPARGEGNPELGNRNQDLGNSNLGNEND